ncbi:hypothetical protein WDT23_05300 [Klebsiella pneumoniae]|uniref:hypothetical protein n=1 Tax=Klebsiella pneumoniae TaxID=573 RepID=UPI0012FE046C|nr:hypothetical protein [Klebsiella pneumoniae]UZS90383.1 hypothetical protein CTI66_26955 [Klebsiella pneumoniae]HBS5731705.1 hypothetical protein [Klebsiella pneumoniae]
MISFRFFLAIITLILITACTTQKAMKETKRQFDNGEYGWAVYTGTIGVTMAAIYDVFTLGGTSDVSSGTNTLSSVTSSISPNSNAAKMLSPMASSSTLLSTENDTSETRQISDVSNNTETRNDIDLSTFNAVEYMERSGNCAKNLSYLSGRLHQSSAPEIKSIRDTILKSDMQPIMLAINKEGISPDEAILQNLQQAEEYNRVVKDAIHTAAQTDGDGITEVQFANQINSGTLNISVCDGIRNSSLCAAIINSYGIIASRAVAANLICYKNTNQWPKG